MIFFRWYGVDVNTFLDVPTLRQSWKYIETIGVSVFNRRASTSKHFGFMRATLRVLYNLDVMTDGSAYIVVGDTTNRWSRCAVPRQRSRDMGPFRISTVGSGRNGRKGRLGDQSF